MVVIKRGTMSISFTYCGVACGVISIDNQFHIGIDPDLSPKGTLVQFKGFVSEKQTDVYKDESLLSKVDVWLITHGHQDHLDDVGKDYLKEKTVISPNRKILDGVPCLNNSVLRWGEEQAFQVADYCITIKALPAYHASNYIMRKIVGKVNGYQLTITSSSETKVIYFTGDTVLYPDLTQNVSKNIDAIFANLGAVKSGSFGGPFTMDLKMLNRMNDFLQPKRIYPIHIDDYSHYKTTKNEVESAGYRVLAVGEIIDI